MRIPPRTGFIVSHRHLVLRRARGASTVKVLLLIPVALVLLLVLAVIFFEARKAYWDHQVKLMCEKDGGVKAYERIQISQEEYKRLGGQQGDIPIYSKSSAAPNDPFFSEEMTVYLRRSDPEVRRSETIYKRKSDNRILGRYVYYARVGGDFPSWAHPSSNGCSFPSEGISRQFIQVKGE